MEIRSFRSGEEAAVIRLWERCGLVRPWNDPMQDIERKRSEQPELFLVGVVDDRIVATAMAGFDGHRGWVYYLAVAPEYRRQSCGRRIMEAVEERLLARGCPKLNIQVRTSNPEVLAFFRRIGFVDDEVVSLGRRLVVDGDDRGTD
jgi:ribosomal protein S18 acetylase RimI-like enzyme